MIDWLATNWFLFAILVVFSWGISYVSTKAVIADYRASNGKVLFTIFLLMISCISGLLFLLSFGINLFR